MEEYGFRKDRSTEHAAYTLNNGIFQAWNNKLQVARIFCALAKAFNCVNHDTQSKNYIMRLILF